MAGILDSLNVAKLALSAQEYAMTIAQRNTANVNNPNYTRQDVIFTDPSNPSNWSLRGVPGVKLEAARGYYLDQSIGHEYSAYQESLVKYNSLLEIDAILQGTSGGGLGASIDAFFNSFTELASNPTSSALRWQVLSSAQTMVDDFHRIYENIRSVQASANRQIERGVTEVNDLTAKIANLNDRIETAQSKGHLETEYALRDERQKFIEELQGKIGVVYFEAYNASTNTTSITITTTKGDALVLGDTSFELTAAIAGDGTPSIDLNGKPITDVITSGEIGGYLQVSKDLIPEYLKRLNEMALAIVKEVNDVHDDGVGLDGSSGGFFRDLTTPGDIAAAAGKISVEITDPSKIAAGFGEAGDNTNAKALAEILTRKLIGDDPANPDKTLSDAYASLLYTVGSDQRTAKEDGEKQQNILNQLLGQRDSASGVSLNEEAVNLIKYQRAYQASARIVSVVNALSAEILNFVR